MQWILVASSPTAVHEYHLVEGGKVQLVLKYNASQKSARIFFEGRQRLVFLERSGFWNNSTVFKNEYGIDLGKVTFEKWHSQNSGVIEVEGKKYHHIRSNNNRPELIVYEKDIQHPLLTCQLSAGSNNADKSEQYYQNDDQEYTGLLVGLCWQLFTPRALKNSLEPATYDYNVAGLILDSPRTRFSSYMTPEFLCFARGIKVPSGADIAY